MMARYSGLLGKFSFIADQMTAGCSNEEAEARWSEHSLMQVFADEIGCTFDEAKDHWDIMQQPEFVMPPEINTRH